MTRLLDGAILLAALAHGPAAWRLREESGQHIADEVDEQAAFAKSFRLRCHSGVTSRHARVGVLTMRDQLGVIGMP